MRAPARNKLSSQGVAVVYDWEVTEEPGDKITAKLCGTTVLVFAAEKGAPGAWRWEVRFADGQVQTGYSNDCDDALSRGKGVAERFLP